MTSPRVSKKDRPESVVPAVGQVWADNDPRVTEGRRGERLVRIIEIHGDRALCEAWYDEPGAKPRAVRIKLARFTPTSTGYRYLRDGDQ